MITVPKVVSIPLPLGHEGVENGRCQGPRLKVMSDQLEGILRTSLEDLALVGSTKLLDGDSPSQLAREVS